MERWNSSQPQFKILTLNTLFTKNLLVKEKCILLENN